MYKGVILSLLVLVFGITFVGCSPGKSVAQPTESRDMAPDVNETDINSLSATQPTESDDIAPDVEDIDRVSLEVSNRTFAFDLFQALRAEEGNLFFSPYSISAALAMTYVGARWETELQIKKIMSYSIPQDRLHPAFNALDQILAKRGEGAQGKDGRGFRLNIVNAIWGQEGCEFLSEYLDILATNYGSGIHLLDLASDPEGSRTTINNWVSE
jgi:serpin B